MNIHLVMLAATLLLVAGGQAQDPASLLEEGRRLELKLKDEDALEKYRQVLVIQPSNLTAVLRSAEVTCAVASRKTSVDEKAAGYEQARRFAEAALRLDSNSAEANYMMAVVLAKLTEVEKRNDEVVKYVKQVKSYIDKALKLDPGFGKAWHVLGKWHLEVVTLSGIKKAALKVIYGGVGEASLATAIECMEKCKTLEPYYTRNFLDLARAYEFGKQYEKSIKLLEQLAKLPTKRQDDVVAKAEGAVMLQKLQ
jgi:tetratricopeptide (TPR) repeat protein